MASPMRSYAMLLGLPFLLGSIACLALIVWDPLDLHPWGKPTALADRPYPMLVRPLLAPTMTRHGKDVVLVGTSTAIAISDAALRRLEAGTAGVDRTGVDRTGVDRTGVDRTSLDRAGLEKPVANLAVVMQRVPDGTLLMREAVQTPDLRRMVIEISHVWLYDAEPSSEPGQRLDRAYHPRWHDLPAFDRDIIRAGLAARDGKFWVADWDDQTAKFMPSTPVELQPSQLADIRGALDAATPADFPAGPTPPDCRPFDAIATALTDTLAIARQRKIAVDVYFSPIPFASLPLLGNQQRGYFGAYGIDETFFARLMAMHRCVVGLVAAQASPAMRVHAVDADPAIIDDLRGMRDPVHYSMAFKTDRIIDDIAGSRMVLTPENFEAYRQRLRQGVIAATANGVPPSQPPGTQ